MSEPAIPREDLRATLAARRDLGPEYEMELIDSFLDRLDHAIAYRVDQHVDRQLAAQDATPSRRHQTGRDDNGVWIALGSLGLGIPLSGVAATTGSAGILIVWIGIVFVNAAYAFSRRRRAGQ